MGEEGHAVDDETAVCDACRDKLQGECGKLGGYPTCMKAVVVKATLQDCQQRRNLKLLQGRLYCKGDTLVKSQNKAASPQVAKPHPRKAKKMKKTMKKIAAAQRVVKSHLVKPVHAAAKRPAKTLEKKKKKTKKTKKKKPHMPTKVVKPPAGLTCEACRDHLTATCTKLGGKAGGMKPCEHDPSYKKIFHKIFSSCNKYRNLKLHKDGSLSCPADNKKQAHPSNKVKKLLPAMPPVHTTHKVKQNKPKAAPKKGAKTKKAKKSAAPKKTTKKAAAKKPTKKKPAAKKNAAKKPTTKKKVAAKKKAAPKKVVSKVEVVKQNKAKASSAQRAAARAH